MITPAPFTSLQDIVSAMTTPAERARLAMFDEGDVLVKACVKETIRQCGFETQEQLLKALGQELGYGRRSLYDRLKVSKTFTDPEERDLPLSWGVFLEASRWNNPHYWIRRAADEGMSKDALKTIAGHEMGKRTKTTKLVQVLRAADSISEWDGTGWILRLKGQHDQLRHGMALQTNAFTEVQDDAHSGETVEIEEMANNGG